MKVSNMIAMIGTSDQLCWLAEDCEILLLLLLCLHIVCSSIKESACNDATKCMDNVLAAP